MTDVQLSPDAENDLLLIKNYVSNELDNPIAANRLISKITRRINELSGFPELGSSLETLLPFSSNYRFLICGN